MRFLIKTAFWLSLVLLLLPFGLGGTDSDGQTIGPLQAFGAAREALADLSQICERKPGVCEAGRAAIHTIGIRARETARIAMEMLDDTAADKDAEPERPLDETVPLAKPDDSIKTGTVAAEPNVTAGQ
ncbi:DUF5330 domain-containing protein [Mesorhizobium xinjiangense]|uniref:DUF5330 domain-containing protein n=1 Tax=Mesorhizobium xinjiangense TaxID=2678685 RepID=UPI0012ED3647|nr:DUF5330 domain-containing protein [Mesorhizobium xinjiangense]